MDQNVFQLWKSIGERLPFAVRRNTWSKESYLIIHDIRIKKYPYGDAAGIFYNNDKPKSQKPEPVSCAGCYQWELVDSSGSKNETYKGNNRKLKVYNKDDCFDFGKYYKSEFSKGHKTIEQVFKDDPSYIKWCLKNVESFCLIPEQLNELNPIETELRIGGKLRKINYERYESLISNKHVDSTIKNTV